MRMWKKGNPSALSVGMQIGAATVESNMEMSQKIKNGTALFHLWKFIQRNPKQ